MIILDTNVVSEIMKPHRDRAVTAWFATQTGQRLRTTAITVAEIHSGLARIDAPGRRAVLTAAFSTLTKGAGRLRVLPFNHDAAETYGQLVGERHAAGLHISQLDHMIASIARTVDAAIATRNTADFAQCGVSLVNPWNGA